MDRTLATEHSRVVLLVAREKAVGTTLGQIAGFYGGWIDNVIVRCTEGLQSIPLERTGALERMDTAWWLWFFSGMLILLTVLSVNLIGNGLRDALDPYFDH